MAAFWRERQATIRTLAERAETLARRLQAAGLPWVLCHADIHTFNVMVDTAGCLWIVDWDETVLAPKERDLMFAAGGISTTLVGPHAETLISEGYDGPEHRGPVQIDPLALAYYRYAWAVQDIGGFAERVFKMPELGVVSKRHAVEGWMSLFQQAEIVALALGSAEGYYLRRKSCLAFEESI